MADLLDMDYINNLPQLWVRKWGSKNFDWPLYDIDVQTGLLRIDVCGMLDVLRIGDVAEFRDADGTVHDPDSFYCEARLPATVTGDANG